jgi:hypothetical protein
MVDSDRAVAQNGKHWPGSSIEMVKSDQALAYKW